MDIATKITKKQKYTSKEGGGLNSINQNKNGSLDISNTLGFH